MLCLASFISAISGAENLVNFQFSFCVRSSGLDITRHIGTKKWHEKHDELMKIIYMTKKYVNKAT